MANKIISIRALILAVILSQAAVEAQADFLDGIRAYREGNYLIAFDEFMTLALNGDATAQFRVGDMYAKGEGVKQDYSQAFSWYLRSAAQDDPRAQLAVAEAYEKGLGVAADQKSATTWYMTAADHGNPRAQYKIGLMYAKGDGMPLDLVQAHKWLALAGDFAAGSKAWVEGMMTDSQLQRAKELELEFRDRYK